MPRVHSISNLAALKAISDPLRARIIRELRQTPRTTAQVAALLGEGATKLHYHMGELERSGLIEVVETRQKGNLMERYYRAVAEFFRVDPLLFQEGPDALPAFQTNVTSILDTAALELHDAVRKGEITPAESGQSLRSLLRLQLTPEQVQDFRSRQEALVAEFREKSGPEGTAGVLLTLLLVPLGTGNGDETDGVKADR